MTTPTLALLGTAPTFSAIALGQGVSSNTEWLMGSTYAISNYGGLYVTPDAFQTTLDGPNSSGSSDAFLQQIMLISPAISFIGSSATGTAPFAAEQLISLYGTELGPFGGSSAQIGPNGAVTSSSGGTPVLFDGVAAPILYAGASQVNAVIPCSTAVKSSTQVVVSYQGAQSAPVALPLRLAAPGIFTVDGSGSGQAAVVNQDGSLNGPANPAARGSTVTFYATGIGASVAVRGWAGVCKQLPNRDIANHGWSRDSWCTGGLLWPLPFLVSGASQINIVIPSGSPTGPVPLTLVVGGAAVSPSGVTISVK